MDKITQLEYYVNAASFRGMMYAVEKLQQKKISPEDERSLDFINEVSDVIEKYKEFYSDKYGKIVNEKEGKELFENIFSSMQEQMTKEIKEKLDIKFG